MEFSDILTVLFIVLLGAAIVSLMSSAYGGDIGKVEHCRSHKWTYAEDGQMVCSVCKYKAHS